MYQMRRKQNEVTDINEIINIINNCDVIRVGMSVNNEPYIVPMNFGFEDGCFYFHGAKEGHKINMIKVNPKVCFELDTDHRMIDGSDRACDWTMKYASVMGNGTMHIVEDPAEKREALDILMRQYGGKESYEYSDRMIERIGIMKLVVSDMVGKRST